MKIYFGTQLTSNAFIDFEARGGCLFDGEVVGTAGLIALLELHYGIHCEEKEVSDSQAEYYNAMSEVMAMGDNVLTPSWNTDSLGVSNACMAWSESLKMAGWRANMKQPSQRLKVLAEVEKHLDSCSLGDRLQRLVSLAKERNALPAGSEICVSAYSSNGVPPLIAELLNNLGKQGVKISYERLEPAAKRGSNLHLLQYIICGGKPDSTRLAKGDESLQVWHFNSELDALRYMATLGKDSFDIYVNRGRKLFDNVQTMMGQPTSGSSLTDANPQLLQLFRLGMGLFEYPLNIRNLLSWLLVPLHPLKARLRYRLAHAIVDTGGLNNEAWDSAIEEYMNSLEDPDERKKAEADISIFLPEPSAEGVDREALLKFLSSLALWCNKMAALDYMPSLKSSQLTKVASTCRSAMEIVGKYDNENISQEELECWTNGLYSSADFSLYDSQAGSKWVVDSADIVDKPNSCAWTDCYNYESSQQVTDFLNSEEKAGLADEGCKLWKQEEFNNASWLASMRPLLKSKQKLVVVTVDKSNGEKAAKHPLTILLEQTWKDSIADITKCPSVEELRLVKIESVDNNDDSAKLQLKHSELLKMPASESYSSLENLIQFPIDYALDRIVRLRESGTLALADLQTTKGNVAHAVIEQLFEGSASDIERRLKSHLDTTIDKTIAERGAILLLKENTIDCRMFKKQLRENLFALLEIISDNNLTVMDREHRVEEHLGLRDGDDDPIVNGFIDMVLTDSHGDIVVFDFKWTTSKNWHSDLLKKNASVQLALYKRMMELQARKPVAATAYFTMPRHRLLTTSQLLTGENVTKVEATDLSDLLPKIVNSYRYRSSQMESGIIENGEGKEIGSLDYGKVTAEKQLVELKEDYDNNNLHASNNFSNYNCLKGGLK